MKDGIWSPANVVTLMHCYAIPKPVENYMKASLDHLVEMGLVYQSSDPGDQFLVTDKGEKLVDMILNTPMPVWADPRNQ